MDARVVRVCWDWHYSWLPWRARIATSNAPRSECWKCMNFTSPFSNDGMTCKKRQTQLNSSARVWWKCGQCWNWSGLKNHFDASFGSGFDSGEFRSESASLNPQAWKTRAKRLNCKWETIMVMLFLLLMAATRLSLVSLSESLGTILVPTNTATWQHSTALGVASLLDRTTREQLNGTLTEPGSSGAMELRTLIGTPACHAGSTAAGCTTFEPKVDNSAASSKVRTLTSDRLQQLKFICLTDCTQKFTTRHEYNPSVRFSFCDLCAIHGKVSFVYSKSWNFIQRSIHVLTKSNDIFQGHLCMETARLCFQVAGFALGITRGSVVCTPLTSFQIWISAAFRAAPMTVAVRSEPSLPRVVMTPLESWCRSSTVTRHNCNDQKVASYVDICWLNAAVWCRLLGNISSDNGNVSIVELQRP